jgi:hypothetical protein
MEPLLSLLYSLLIGILLYIVFRYIMNFSNRMSKVSAIFAGCLSCIYLLVVGEIKRFVILKK